MNHDLPTLQEFTLGVFLHDIGKFMQRAFGSLRSMDTAVRALEDQILPLRDGRRTHYHALWTEAFFTALQHRQLPEVRFPQVRNTAVFHHSPSPNIPLTELAARADVLSAGMDRKPRDEQQESEAEDPGWDAFIRTPLKNPLAAVDLKIGLGDRPESEIPLGELIPGARLLPVPSVDASDYQTRYRVLWDDFLGQFEAACELPSFPLFAEALLSLSERFTFAIPSSTKDQPDISLHDHSRTAAAIAAALYCWHQHDGSLTDSQRIRDDSLPKLRFLAGDLSGIQRTLFRFAAEQVKGLSKILRARSLLMALSAEAAALAARRRLGLPPFSLLQNAGGRFLLLLPNLPEVEEKIEDLRRTLDDWFRFRYYGELVLILALSDPFAPRDLMREKFPALLASLNLAVERAKLRPLASTPPARIEARYPGRACAACGVRPAEQDEPESRCGFCDHEHRLGGDLLRLHMMRWMLQPAGRIRFFDDLALDWDFDLKKPGRDWLSAFRLYRPAAERSALPLRFLAGYVPRLGEDEMSKPAYVLLSKEAKETRPGDLKTFEHIALDGVESYNGDLLGEPLLAVFKADVDRLGFIFSHGFPDRTLSRFASVSRMLDFFFTGYLPELLRQSFASVYTVYAGGDDMLLIGPWRQVLEMACELQQQFARWAGLNPNVTLSAGIELLKPQYPIGPAVRRAEDRLEAAKRCKNRIALIVADPLDWPVFAKALEHAEQLSRWLRQELINRIFLHRLLYFADQRRLAEPRTGQPMDLKAASWPARWGYYLARHIARLGEERRAQAEEVRKFALSLLGLDRDLRRVDDLPLPPRLPVTIALYQNRSAKEHSRR